MRKKILIGIMSQERIRSRALAIARGEYKPTRGEPKIWFPSMKSAAEVLSDKNRSLLQIIAQQKPKSLTELSIISGRAVGNLSRTLKTMERYGFVELKKEKKTVRAVAKAVEFLIHAA